MASRYKFENIFKYFPEQGTIVPLYTVVINGISIGRGSAIRNNYFNTGLNLFNYIGRDIYGVWDNDKNMLVIEGFY